MESADHAPASPRASGTGAAIGEAVAVAAGGGALAFGTGQLIGPTPVAVVLGVVGALNGAICGWRHVCSWGRPSGWTAVVLDSTWSLPNTALALVAHLVAAIRRGGYEPSMSIRQNRHVYRGGAHLQAGYVFTIGNVVSSAGDVDAPRRRKLIVDHEDVHVWQARWWGPAYVTLYIAWAILASVGGVVVWLARGRREPFAKAIRSTGYYMNPFEWWAYCRDDLWPPSGVVRGFGWRGRIVRPFAPARAAKHLDLTERHRHR